MLEEVAVVSEQQEERCFVLGSLGLKTFLRDPKHDY